MLGNKYDATFLAQRKANYTPLSPVSFVKRSGTYFPDVTAIEYGDFRQRWGETYARCRKIAASLRGQGANGNSTIAALLPNVPAAVELAYAVPMSGAVLNMINTRLDPAGVAFILDHAEAEFFFVDSGLSELAVQALALCETQPVVIYCDDPTAPGNSPAGAIDYEAFFKDVEALDEEALLPADEWDAIALNYTSGTTGNPKGVVYHHRGAYLAALGNGAEWAMPYHPRYLWTLPLFHCNGWTFPWVLAAYAGTNVCLRTTEPSAILSAITTHGITHMCGAPIIVSMLATEAEKQGEALEPAIKMMTAGAPPPAAVLERAAAVGLDVTHVYGLTEVYGPITRCAWNPDWDALPAADQAELKARQGVAYNVLEESSVRSAETLEATPWDTLAMGEVMFRGNTVMKGYLKNPDATQEAFDGEFFRSGDLAVTHEDGFIELKDRSKDIIISGGENISSIEVESVFYKHPAVAAAAVVAESDEKWGETPVAFIELQDGAHAEPEELIAFARERLAHFKCPRKVVIGDLPKTSTGKIQKFLVRKLVQG
ncbi:MAG: AMP-binding protein [Erythrobacter sp.]|nr:AMP-binding protein [Erythrobacter sp.]